MLTTLPVPSPMPAGGHQRATDPASSLAQHFHSLQDADQFQHSGRQQKAPQASWHQLSISRLVVTWRDSRACAQTGSLCPPSPAASRSAAGICARPGQTVVPAGGSAVPPVGAGSFEAYAAGSPELPDMYATTVGRSQPPNSTDRRLLARVRRGDSTTHRDRHQALTRRPLAYAMPSLGAWPLASRPRSEARMPYAR